MTLAQLRRLPARLDDSRQTLTAKELFRTRSALNSLRRPLSGHLLQCLHCAPPPGFSRAGGEPLSVDGLSHIVSVSTTTGGFMAIYLPLSLQFFTLRSARRADSRIYLRRVLIVTDLAHRASIRPTDPILLSRPAAHLDPLTVLRVII